MTDFAALDALSRRRVRLVVGETVVEVTASDAMLILSDQLLRGDAFVKADRDEPGLYRRVAPTDKETLMPQHDPHASWTDKVPGHPDDIVWGDVSDPELLRLARSFSVLGSASRSWSRRQLLDSIAASKPEGWRWPA